MSGGSSNDWKSGNVFEEEHARFYLRVSWVFVFIEHPMRDGQPAEESCPPRVSSLLRAVTNYGDKRARTQIPGSRAARNRAASAGQELVRSHSRETDPCPVKDQ